MEITLAEFSQFNLKSKLQILDYKAVFIGEIKLSKRRSLQLYVLNNAFITVQKNRNTQVPLWINTRVKDDILYLFAEDIALAHFIKNK